MHVLIIPSWYPSNNKDVHGSFFREQAIALGRKNQVGVIYPYFISLHKILNFKSLKRNQIKEDENIIFLSNFNVNFYPKARKTFLKKWIEKALDLFNEYTDEYGYPDVIHVQSMLPAGLVAVEIKKKYNIPFILTEHSSKYFLNESSIDGNCLEVINNSDYLSAVSDYYADFLSKKTNKKWHVIPNIVNDNFFSKEINMVGDKIVFITVSFLNKNKNTILFLKSINLLIKKLSNDEIKKVRFIVGGDGPELLSLKNYVKYNNLQDYVYFTGKLSREQVVDYISSSSAFILSSKFETFSVVCAEANALGKPVISTKCGGPEYILNSKNGILIDNNDEYNLAEAILKYMVNRGLYNSMEIRESCRKRFGEKNIVKQISEIYFNVVNKE